MAETPAEKARRLGVPLVPRITPTVPGEPLTPSGVVAVYGECGLELTRIMGYVCSRTNCPTGLGSFSCASPVTY